MPRSSFASGLPRTVDRRALTNRLPHALRKVSPIGTTPSGVVRSSRSPPLTVGGACASGVDVSVVYFSSGATPLLSFPLKVDPLETCIRLGHPHKKTIKVQVRAMQTNFGVCY